MDHAPRERKLSGEFKAVRTSTCLALLLLAVLHTAGNLAKPLHIDDAAYYYYARQASQKPLDPYGFEVFWWDNPEEANKVLAPPVLSYWWSLSMHIDHAVSSATGIDMERPWIWKLGMVPFSLLFIGCLYTLFRHFTRGLEMPLTWLTVLSPTFWPSLNLMLDIPAMSLSLLAILLFKRACDRSAPGLAALSGFVAGLAMEMKYTAFLTPAAMLLYSLFLGKCRLWPVAGIVAAQVFVVWELLIAMLYGESHFLYHYRLRAHEGWLHRLSLLLPMLGILGSIAPALVLLALKGIRAPWPFLVAVAFVAILGYGLVAWIEDSKDTRLSTLIDRYVSAGAGGPHLPFQECWFGAWGAFLVALSVCVAALLAGFYPRPVNLRARGNRINRRPFFTRHAHRVLAFLVLWLLLEIAGYVTLTPFVAVRRLMGVIIVATLIVGSLAARTCRHRGGRGIVWAIAGYGMLLGIGFTALDWRDAQAEQEAVERSADFINARGGGKIWFASHWGFQYYAEHAGMEMISPTESRLEKGDWVVHPYELTKQHIDWDSIPGDPEADIVIDDAVSLQTVWCYYIGYTAIENRSGPRVTARIYRVTAPCIPERPKRRS
jgi:hypothetical protein